RRAVLRPRSALDAPDRERPPRREPAPRHHDAHRVPRRAVDDADGELDGAPPARPPRRGRARGPRAQHGSGGEPVPRARGAGRGGMTWVQDLGAIALRFVDDLGGLGVFASRIGRAMLTPPARFRAFLDELYKLGVLSIVIITVCGAAVGMVIGLQGYNTLVRF